jgi:peptidoglycan/LPS O-acetylase OafA/YrhL
MTVQQPHLSHPKYRPDIDGLRAVAVLAVVAFHAFPSWVRGGFIGVDIFFVISGYLISTIIFENLEKGTFSFSEFYSRRIRRIFPALLLVLIACFAFGWFALLADEYKQLGKHIAAGAGFISNFILWNEAGYFDNSAETKPLLHLWSLGIEEQFYIVWPIFLWFAWKRKFNLLTITALVAIATFVLNIKGGKQDIVATFYSPQTRFWELLSGSFLAWMTLYKKHAFTNFWHKLDYWLSRAVYSEKQEADGKMLSNALSFVGLLLLVYGFWRINKELSFPGKWALVPVLGAVLIISAGSKAWVNRTILSNKLTVWFGLISFPLYLWHWPILSFARIVESEVPSRNIRIAAVVLSVVLAWLTYKLIERPLRFGKHSTVKVAALVLLMAIVGYVGFNTYDRDGYEFRSFIKGFVNNKNELIRTQSIDDECLKYIGIAKPLFPYCRFTNANSNETVAVIGDSHAHVAYPGIAEYLRNKGISTVLLANSGCPPFVGSYQGSNQVEKDACRDRIEQLLDTVSNHKDIRKVFVFTRGPTYNTGTEPLTGSKDLTGGNNIPITEFANSAQLSFDKLSKSRKLIFYITENPELSYSAESCLSRPFKSIVRNCAVEKNSVLERQADYLSAFNKLKNVTVIDSLGAFCPHKTCIVFDDNGSLLYADGDHLSIAGSRFQVNRLLKQFLD